LAALATRSHRLNWPVRAATIVAIVAVHVGLLALLASHRQTRERPLESFSAVWLSLSGDPARDFSRTDIEPTLETATAASTSESRRPARDGGEPRARERDAAVRAEVPADAPAVASGTTLGATDWYGAIDTSVAATISGANDRARRYRAFEPKRTPGLAEPPRWVRPPPHFRWSRSRTQRIERGEDGTTIVWLNDRCVLVNFVMPFCAVGKIPAHGDLFKDLKRAAELGDWIDDSAERRADADLLQDFP
jgi:hypothetical protein